MPGSGSGPGRGGRGERRQGGFDDFVRLGEAAEPFVPAGEEALGGADEAGSATFERGHVLLCGRVQPHVAVHRGGDEQRGAGGESDLGQGVAGEAEGELGDEVGGGWGEQDQRGAIGQRNVDRLPVGLGGVGCADDRVAGKGLEVRGVMKRSAASVMTTCTSTPSLTKRLAMSAAL